MVKRYILDTFVLNYNNRPRMTKNYLRQIFWKECSVVWICCSSLLTKMLTGNVHNNADTELLFANMNY